MKMPDTFPVVAFRPTDKRLVRGCWTTVMAYLLLSGCQYPGAAKEDTPSDPDPAQTAAEAAVEDSATAGESPAKSGLTPDLLYNILTSDMAMDREQPALALDYLIRATAISSDRRLLTRGIELAMSVQEHRQVVELSRRLLALEPDNFRANLVHAEGLFRTGQSEAALTRILDLIRERPQSRLDTLSESVDLLLRQENRGILDEFLKLVESAPSAELSLAAAILSVRQQHINAYSRWIERALELAPDWEEAAILKLDFLEGRNPDGALQYAAHHLDAYPEQVDFRIRYGGILLNHDRIEDSLTQFSEVLEHDPRSEHALVVLGALHVELEEPEQARLMFEQALSVNSGNDQTRLYLAQLAHDADDYDTAIRHLRSVSTPEHYLGAQVALGRINYELHGIESGIRYLDRISVQTREDKIGIIQEQARLYREEGMLDRTRALLDEGLERFPDQPDLLYNRGLLFAEMDLLQLHEQDMRALIALEPDNAHAYNALGYTLADKTDRLDEAMTLIVEANRLLPDNGLILDSLGWVYYRLGNTGKALEYLEQAWETQQDAEIAAHLGEVLWMLGQYNEAREIWFQGIQQGRDNTVLNNTINRLDAEQSGNLVNEAES